MGTRLVWNYGVMQVVIKIKIGEICCFTGLLLIKLLKQYKTLKK
jgi:hypothetical protein